MKPTISSEFNSPENPRILVPMLSYPHRILAKKPIRSNSANFQKDYQITNKCPFSLYKESIFIVIYEKRI